MNLANLKNRARELKRDVTALGLACRRKDVPWYAKALAAIVVAYALSPIDLIPDFIPVLGYLDDVILVPAGIALTLRLIPKDVMAACRAEAEALPKAKRNWIAGGVIIALWAVGVIVLLRFFFKA